MRDIWDFIKRYKVQLISLFLILGCTYFFYFQNIISIDTEIYINNPKEILKSWISIDRWSLVILKQIIMLFPFQIVLTRSLTIIVFFLAIILYTYLFTKWAHIDNKWLVFLTSLVLATSPIFAEQFGFTLQSIEISLGLLLFAVDFILIDKYLAKGNKIYSCLIITLTTFCFGLYQAFVILFISIVLFYILTHDEKSLKKFIYLFLISFGANYLINYLFKNKIYAISSSYLTNNFQWSKNGFIGSILRIGYYSLNILIGSTWFHSISFGILFLILGIYLCKHKKFKKLFFLFCLCLTPFLLIIATSSNTAIRAQFSYVFVLDFLFLYGYSSLQKKKILYFLFALAIGKNIIATPFLLYQDSIRYQKDLNLAETVRQNIANEQEKCVIFVGTYLSNTSFKGETLGYSFASWDYELEFGVNSRMYGFLKAQGIESKFPTKEQYLEALSRENHGYYPDTNGIINEDDKVIIYLK